MNEEITITPEQAAKMRAELKEIIDLNDSLIRLENNQDFKKVFRQNYLVTEAARYVSLLADQNIKSDKNAEAYRNDILESLIGIAKFGEYLRKTHVLGEQARHELDELNNSI